MLLLVSVFWFPVAFAALKWSRLPAAARRAIRWALAAAGVLCLAVAPWVPGGYVQDVSLFIGGPNAYRVETVSRSHTGLLVGVGAIFLALFGVARWGGRLSGASPLAAAFKLSFAVILLRVVLEKIGVPLRVATWVGVIWLAAPLGVYFGLEAVARGRPGRFWRWLLTYAFGLRLAIIAIMIVATLFQLGTHFDNSGVVEYTVFGQTTQVESRSFDQIAQLVLFPQLVLWPAVTLVLGILFGVPARAIAARRRRA